MGAKVDEGIELHTSINNKVKRFLSNETKKQSGKKLAKKRSKRDMSNRKKKQVVKQREYFFDYNTVEQVLLACAIFVSLAGVMFESDRFDDDKNGSLVKENRYAWQRDMITYITGTVVIFSFVYYFFVFTSEVFGFTPKIVKRLFSNRKRGFGSLQENEDQRSSVVLSLNPIKSDQLTIKRLRQLEKDLANKDKKIVQMANLNKELIQNKRTNKQETTKAVGMALPGKGRKNKAKKDKNKKQFTQQFVDHE